MKRQTSLGIGCLLYSALCATPCWSQSTAEIRGRVLDESHRPVVSAFVILTAQDTSTMRAASTDEAGEFAFPALLVGTYALQVNADGFVSFDSKEVRASIGQVTRLEIVLYTQASGSVQRRTGTATSLVETGNAQLGVVMSQNEVVQLPLKSRDTFELLQLQPGVQSTLGADLFYGSDRPGVV